MTMFFTEWLQYAFMRHAFVAILIITPLFGMLGTMIVERKMAFFRRVGTFGADGHCGRRGLRRFRYDGFDAAVCGCICSLVKPAWKEGTGGERYNDLRVFQLQYRGGACDLVKEVISASTQACWSVIF